MAHTLVLNADYSPIGAISWQKAITLFFSGKVEVIDNYDRDIRSTSITIKMPAVVRLLKYVKHLKASLRFNKHNVYIRDNGRCQYCDQEISKSQATYDHVIPKSRGGKTNWSNIVIACSLCNRRKDCKTLEESGMTLRKAPVKPSNLPMNVSFQMQFAVGNKFPNKWKTWFIDLKVE